MPADFAISDAVRDWAARNGHHNLQAHFDSFLGKARANGYVYVDWDQALQNAIREDWARIGNQPRAGPGATTLGKAGQATARNAQAWLEGSDK